MATIPDIEEKLVKELTPQLKNNITVAAKEALRSSRW